MKQFKVSKEIYTLRNDNINSYFNEVNSIEMLTPEEESELAFKMSQGCQKSKDKIIKANLKFVISVAKAYHRNNAFLTLEDLINEGNFGMIEAAEKFDPSHGFKFISFAVWHIRRRIRECITKNSRHIKIPENHVWVANKISKVQAEYLNHEGRLPTPHEIQEGLEKMEYPPDVSLNVIKQIIKGQDLTTSLDQGIPGLGDDGLDFSPINYVEHSDAMEDIKEFEYSQFIKELFKGLNGMEIDMLSMRIGIPPYDNRHKYKAIGEKWGYTGESARLKIQKTIKKLKFRNKGLIKAMLDGRG